MKQKNKLIFLTVAILAVLTTSVMGTLAYLTDTDGDVNTFTVGQVYISLDEAKVNPDGTPIEGAARVKENSYHILPGHTYTKDPTVTVESGSQESYIRMLITFSNATALNTIIGDNLTSMFNGLDENIWLYETKSTDTTLDTVTYEFRYYETVGAGSDDVALDALFDSVTMPGTLDAGDLKQISDLTITAQAHAIQAAGFGTADDAWVAFESQVNN